MTSSNDIEEPGDYAQPWSPQAGDEITGRIATIDSRDGGYGEYPIITIALEDGREVAIHAYHSILVAELAKLEPRIDETIAIAYRGLKTARDGRSSYHLYAVHMPDRPPPKFAWSKFGDAPGEVAAVMAATEERSPVDAAMGEGAKDGGDDETIPF